MLLSSVHSLSFSGVGGAEKGTLTFMVGGETKDFDSAKPLLSHMGKNIVHCGPVGSGQVCLYSMRSEDRQTV